jgi:outer membrane protein assembly factor BamA
MWGSRVRAVAAVAMICVLIAVPQALAQESRLEVLARQRAEKANQLRSHEPNIAEAVLDVLSSFPMLSDSPHGLYPLMGGIIDGAGWLKVGVAHRRNFGDAGYVTTQARVSNRGYWQVGGEVQAPDVVPGRLAMRVDAWHLHARDVSYYGIGNIPTAGDDPDPYKLQATTAGLSGTLRTVGHLSVGGRASYDRIVTGPPTIQEPNSDTLVRVADAPGFGAPLDYAHAEVFADLDWRQSPSYTRTGGRARLGVHRYDQLNGSESGFTRVDGEVAQFFPFLHGSRVVALRGLVTLTSPDSGQEVPYHLLPFLGGRNTVRSFPSFRFRDRHRLLFNAEYRWRATELFDMALFGDAGKVASTTRDLDLSDLHTAIGIGIRLHGPTYTAIRLAAAYGSDGGRLQVAFGPVF